jgi:hypothetical protein
MPQGEPPVDARSGAHQARHLLAEAAVLAGPPLALALLMVALVSPVAEFPLNDSWIFTSTVRTLVEEGRYVRHPFG